ncbi:DUF6461 domain-containing protein [Streptosporangium lutulentum]|uniref:Uncharacterized protein n=1 Tax=Streptosporangium lutulentum TaxID=1461250 RepID=A0ABT9QL29_9ACTN|nr:DUF6461 domain-containing protein [Streptosporangium lutulentum]MDP9847450.1 hypothetical protein [Streptosporangium lutulentum]
MSGTTAADYVWFNEQYGDTLAVSGFCVTFVKDLTPVEALNQIGVVIEEGADPDDIDGFDEYPIVASAAAGGTILVEQGGYSCSLDDVANRLSRGTVTATVFRNVNFDQAFIQSENGSVVLTFDSDMPYDRSCHSDRMLSHMRDLGMPLEESDAPDPNYILTAFALAERATGVRLLPAHIDKPTLLGTTEHLC